MIINESFFKKYSPIPVNYNMAEIKNYIGVAEKIWVKPLIGYDLFDELEEQVESNTVSEENATLLTEGGLWQYLSFATVLEALPLDLKDMTYVGQHLRNQVEVLKDQLKKWICEHHEYYPLADVCACECSCCKHAELNYPNPNKELYTTRRKCTDLK